MDEKGVELLIRETTPNHKVKNLGLEYFNLPVTESISKDAMRIPCYPELRNDEIDFIVEFFNIRKHVRFGVLESIDNGKHLKEIFGLNK